MKESYFQNKLRKDLVSKGYEVLVFCDSFTTGIPDMYACKDGQGHWMEVKVTNKKEGQTIHLDEAKASERGFSRKQAIQLFKFKEKGMNAYGVIYVAKAQEMVRIEPEQMKDSFTYKELLELPRVAF